MSVRIRTHKELEEKIKEISKEKSNGYNISYLSELDKIMMLFENLEYTVRTRLEPLESAVDPMIANPSAVAKLDALKWFVNRSDE